MLLWVGASGSVTCACVFVHVTCMCLPLRQLLQNSGATETLKPQRCILIILCALFKCSQREPCKGVMYSGKKKYVNPLELPGFLHKLVIKFDLIYVPTIDKHSVLKIITQITVYVLSILNTSFKHSQYGLEKLCEPQG